MKKIANNAQHCNRISSAKEQTINKKLHRSITPVFLFSSVFLLVSCTKELQNQELENISPINASSAKAINKYEELSQETIFQLQMAKAATAKYQNIKQAISDGYVDISVDVEHMGHHYMKQSLANNTLFDPQMPEILVYNRNLKGQQELVAVEYAVPISLTDTAPEGFIGDSDVWDRNTTFGLWLLHAWVFAYNPLGVFNPTNPTVHLH